MITGPQFCQTDRAGARVRPMASRWSFLAMTLPTAAGQNPSSEAVVALPQLPPSHAVGESGTPPKTKRLLAVSIFRRNRMVGTDHWHGPKQGIGGTTTYAFLAEWQR